MLAMYERALRKFPFSRLAPRAALSVYALEIAEPPQAEYQFEGAFTPAEVIARARDFEHDDCAYQLDCYWDLWTHSTGWELQPSRVSITCYAPLFPSELGEQLSFDLGLDAQFLPRSQAATDLRAARSNVRSLLHLAKDIQSAAPVEKRTLWSESGENFAGRLEAVLAQAETEPQN